MALRGGASKKRRYAHYLDVVSRHIGLLEKYNRGPLIDHAYPVFLKEKYKTNDYYNAAVYSVASGSISSQKGLMIVLFNKTIVKLDEYERSMESSSDTLGRVIHESDKFKFVKIKRIKK